MENIILFYTLKADEDKLHFYFIFRWAIGAFNDASQRERQRKDEIKGSVRPIANAIITNSYTFS